MINPKIEAIKLISKNSGIDEKMVARIFFEGYLSGINTNIKENETITNEILEFILEK